MDIPGLITALLTMAAASVVIMLACNSFEEASGYLGRHVYKMPGGVRGATIDAIGSSMPELFTTTFLLFYYTDLDGFSAGIATCAGSAVFNAVIIPALCILVVTVRGIKKNGGVIKLPHINLKRATIMRDAFFFLLAEVTLIVFLAQSTVGWQMGAALVFVYLLYAAYLVHETQAHRKSADHTAPESTDEHDEPAGSFLAKLIRLDFNGLLFQGQAFSPKRAWVVLLLATGTVGAACHFLAGAVMDSAAAMNVAPYFAAIILGAAATSVPDTVLSVKAAASGDYDDAVSNAMGSNIFDICIALGLPLVLFSLLNNGMSVSLSSGGDGAANVQDLRVALIALTVLVVVVFLYDIGSGKREPGRIRVGKGKAFMLLGFYVCWTGYIVAQGSGWV